MGNILRGLKWATIKETAERKNDLKTLKWLLSQEAIQADLKAYEDSVKITPEKPKKAGRKA